jgi:DNA-binding NarL/FixJ family response regulator
MSLVAIHLNGGVLVRPERDDDPRMIGRPTVRELEVLRLVAEGMTNAAIGERLGINERTVKSHMTYVMVRIGARDRTHAVVIAIKLGLIEV